MVVADDDGMFRSLLLASSFLRASSDSPPPWLGVSSGLTRTASRLIGMLGTARSISKITQVVRLTLEHPSSRRDTILILIDFSLESLVGRFRLDTCRCSSLLCGQLIESENGVTGSWNFECVSLFTVSDDA